MKLAGIIIMFHPEMYVWDNINTYIEDINILYVLDNSEYYNDNLLSKLQKNPKVRYISMNGNQGLAKALSKGCKLAKEEGYEYVLTMDQDSKFEDNAVAKLKKYMKNHKEYSIIAANAKSIDKDGKTLYIRKSGVDIREVYWVMTSGSLMNLKDYFEAGGFNEELFVGGIDIDIGIKLHMLNKKIGVLENAIILQRYGNSEERKLFGKKIYVYFGNDINCYYYARNDMYLRLKYGKKIWKKTGVSLWKGIIKTLLYEDRKLHRIKIRLMGYKDGIFRKMGKCEHI